MNALRAFGFGLVAVGGMVAATEAWAQCPVPQANAVPAPVPAQVTQRRAFSYEPALAAPTRTFAPNYTRGGNYGYGRPAYMTQKTLR